MALAMNKTVTMKVVAPSKSKTGEDIIWSRGLQFPDRSEILSPRVRRALRFKNYEKVEAEAVKGQVKEDDVVLELGGGIGFMSSLIAKSCKPKAIHVYEPNPDAVAYMRDVHALNGVESVEVHNAIVGAKKGTATFYQRDNILTSSLEEDPIRIDSKVVAQREIDVLNINTVWKAVKPTVLVCDIEGGEADLFAKAQMTGLRLAVIEVHPQWIGEAGVRNVFEAMHNAGLTYLPKPSSGKVIVFKKGW